MNNLENIVLKEPTLKRVFRGRSAFKVINRQHLKDKGRYLWRYLDIHKFLDFKLSNEIVFNRMDQFTDPLEGVPLASLIMFAEEMDANSVGDITLSEIILNKEIENGLSERLKKQIERTKRFQLTTFASCWFLSNQESMAMWDLYSNPDGLVIRINRSFLIKKIEEAYHNLIENHNSIKAGYAGAVKYLSFKSIKPYEANSEFSSKIGLRKESSYEHEKEFRFVMNTTHIDASVKSIRLKLSDVTPKVISIFTHPRMAEWKKENLKKILKESGMEKKLYNSEIRLRSY
jgi:hypothetical protein